MTSLHTQTMAEVSAAVAGGKVSAVEVTKHFLGRIKEHDGRVGAFLHVDEKGALAQAASVDARRGKGEKLGALAGVPIALKDNICTEGVPTTCASKMLKGYVPPYDAHVVDRLRAADAVLIGKTNMDEFAMGSSTENSAVQKTMNPWDLSRAPGGSSGGSAAATAAAFALGALGSDTGGSVRQPGAFCGVAALKPTYGRVSRYGVVAFASSLDQVGTFGATVQDAAQLLSVVAGYDGRDATSAKRADEKFEDACGEDVRGMKVGVVGLGDAKGISPDVASAMAESVARLKERGAVLVDVALPHAEYAIPVYYLVATAEAASNLARFDGVRYGHRSADAKDLKEMYEKSRGEGFGPEVKLRIMLGNYALSAGYYDAFYLRAQKVRTLIRQDYAKAFEACDVLVTPTAPTPAFKLGEKTSDPLEMYLADIFTVPASLAGLPAMSVVSGFASGDLPVGVQFVAPAFEERRLVKVGHALEQALGPVRRPPAFT